MAASPNPYGLVLTAEAETQNEVFLKAFNSGDGAIFDSLYHEDSISNLTGAPLSGEARTAAIKELLSLGPRLDSSVRYAYRAGDTALVVVAFTLDFTTPDGQDVHLEGSCTDVLREDEDGVWYMAVDRPVLKDEDQLPW
ncbi:YybH family protein [Streptomyces sp. NPDC090127]|uniref:YybH family protein n=1 Tax=Streptomyces sp. NPDC090127 TaxID=3365953 RepID=UPI0037F9DD4F